MVDMITVNRAISNSRVNTPCDSRASLDTQNNAQEQQQQQY